MALIPDRLHAREKISMPVRRAAIPFALPAMPIAGQPHREYDDDSTWQ